MVLDILRVHRISKKRNNICTIFFTLSVITLETQLFLSFEFEFETLLPKTTVKIQIYKCTNQCLVKGDHKIATKC